MRTDVPTHPALALTAKQRAFVEHYIATGGNAPEAAERAYNCTNRGSARVLAHRNLHNPLVKRYVECLLREYKTPEKVVESLKEQLEATRVVAVNGKITEVPDNEARLKAIELVIKVIGY